MPSHETGRGGRHASRRTPRTPAPAPAPAGGAHRRRRDEASPFSTVTVRTTEDGREVRMHRDGDHPPVRHAGRAPEEEHPAPDADKRPAGGKPERRRAHKAIRTVTGLGFTGLALAGAITLGKGIFTDNAPDKVPTGPSLLDPTNHATQANPTTGEAWKNKLRMDVQRQVNNGEHGKTVTIAPGILTVETPDGQHVSYANPIVNLDGLTQQAAANVRAGSFDASSWKLLDGRVFATGAAKDTPIQGQEGPNFDRGIVDIDVTGTDAHFTSSPNGPHLTDVAVDWHSAAPIAVGSGGPLEQNIKNGQYGQHAVGGDWQPMQVGAQVPTPPSGGQHS